MDGRWDPSGGQKMNRSRGKVMDVSVYERTLGKRKKIFTTYIIMEYKRNVCECDAWTNVWTYDGRESIKSREEYGKGPFTANDTSSYIIPV